MAWSQDKRYEVCPLKVGEAVPEVNLMTAKSGSIQLTELLSEKPTVIVFYRGAWCGYCTKHLAELNDIKGSIEDLGYQIIGVTVDQPTKLNESIIKSGDEIEVYSDSKLEASKAFGLDWHVDDELFQKYVNQYKLDLEKWSGEDHHALPVPAIYIIKDEKVEFQYVNPDHSVRLKAETLLGILETI